MSAAAAVAESAETKKTAAAAECPLSCGCFIPGLYFGSSAHRVYSFIQFNDNLSSFFLDSRFFLLLVVVDVVVG